MTYMTSIIKTWAVAATAAVAMTSCSEESSKMIWEATAAPAENVEVICDPSSYQQIRITANGDAGQVTLKCTNFSMLSIIGTINADGEYENKECRYRASVTAPGTVRIILDKMPDGFSLTSASLRIDGREGSDANNTNVGITRKP